MQWTADVSAGEWLTERLDDGRDRFATMHAWVPRGFPAYARIFHRPGVSWVEGRAFPTPEEFRETRPERLPAVCEAPSTWAEAAAAFGTEVHGTAQWNRIVRRGGGTDSGEWDDVIGPDGRAYTAPEAGRLDASQLAHVARHLAAGTSTPDDVLVALWEGWGGLVGFLGQHPANVVLAALPDDFGLADHHRAMVERSIRDPFNNVFRKPTWQPGILSDEASRGPRLRLPDRDHVLFRGSIDALADPTWVKTVPWGAENPEWTQSPSLLWPADRAWVLATEIEADSTIVAGAAELVRALCTDPGIEARALREGADLSWDADEVNR